MSHHKRRRPKHQRGGCLFCKGYKDEREKGSAEAEAPRVRRRKPDDPMRMLLEIERETDAIRKRVEALCR